MPQNAILVCDDVSLGQLLEGKPIAGIVSKGQILVRLSSLTPSETEYWQRQLNELYFECGCDAGAIAVFFSLGLYLVFLFFRPGGLFATSWTDIGIGLIVFLASAVAGKGFGLLRAKHRLKKAVEQLRDKEALTRLKEDGDGIDLQPVIQAWRQNM